MWVSEEEQKYRQGQEESWEKIRKAAVRKTANRRRKKARNARFNLAFEMATERTKLYLKEFWPRFNVAKDDLERFRLLQSAADPGWGRVSYTVRMKCRRDKFHDVGKLFDNMGLVKCGTCDNFGWERHHIVPCCYGGPTIAENIILICGDCHNRVHPWLT